MAVTMRLSRKGRRNRPFYRIVVADASKPRDGRFLEILGHYDPLGPTAPVTVRADRVKYWLGQGVTVSDTVRSLLKRAAPLTPPSPSRGEGAGKGKAKGAKGD